MDILKGEIKIYSINDDEVYEVDFMNLVVDKADGLKVVDCDNHFCEFTGVHPSKIKQGKLFLHNIIKPIYREEIMRALCKKNCTQYMRKPAAGADSNNWGVNRNHQALDSGKNKGDGRPSGQENLSGNPYRSEPGTYRSVGVTGRHD